jgi:hypothetical protein
MLSRYLSGAWSVQISTSTPYIYVRNVSNVKTIASSSNSIALYFSSIVVNRRETKDTGCSCLSSSDFCSKVPAIPILLASVHIVIGKFGLKCFKRGGLVS